MVKRLFAVASGATMLGATAMGALAAADLNTYPGMFVTDTTFDGFFVVGKNADAIDNLAMTDIATSMKVAGASSGTTATSVDGDAWRVESGSKKFEIANSNASASAIGSETFRDINSFVGEEELAALTDGTWATNENDYGYQQFLFFDDDGDQGVNRIVKFVEDEDDKTADNLLFKSGRQIARFKLEFTATAQSDVTDTGGTADTTGGTLDDFENTDITLMGKPYSVVIAERPNTGDDARQNNAKLTLMGGSTRDTLLEGETKTYTVGDKSYEVTLTYTDADEAKFTVNGEQSNKLKVGETYVLSDKSEIGVSEVLYQGYAGGVHSATFFVGASKLVLHDNDITSAALGNQRLKVGSEEIDGTSVVITGTDNNSTFTISTIEVNMTADDDYFVGAGAKLSDVITASGEEEQVLMNGAYDVEYKGLTEVATNVIGLKAASGRRYELNLYDGDGKLVKLPVAYAESTSNLTFGSDTGSAGRTSQKRTILNKFHPIYKNDFFVVTGGTASDGSAKSYMFQYKGADKSTDTSPKIRFKNEGNGESLEYAASAVGLGGTVATIKVGGYSFDVTLGEGTQAADDYRVNVALDTAAVTYTAADNASAYWHVPFVDYYGSVWNTSIWINTSDQQTVLYLNATSLIPYNTLKGVGVAVTTPNADDYDNVVPTNLHLNITPTTGPEVNANIITAGSGLYVGSAAGSINLVTPSGESEIAYGYTSMGGKITHNNPSSDPDEVTFAYPEKQVLPQVYFTSGATTTKSTTTGDLVAVQVVDATKLDEEVASVTAQNLIVVGGPCVNTVAAELLGNPTDCTQGFAPGKSRVKLWEHASTGKMAMLVAGYSGQDTRLAGKVIAHRWKELSGDEVEVEGTTYSDATIAAPSSMTETAADTTQQ